MYGPKDRIIEKDVKQFLKDRPRMTPLAKRIAYEGGLRNNEYGTGLAGTARATDLAATENKIYGVEYEDRKISNMRKIIAKSMHASLQNSAQLTHHLSEMQKVAGVRKNCKGSTRRKNN